MAPETGEIVYGSVASRGGSAIELDPRFTLNVKRLDMADVNVKIDEGGVEEEDVAKIEKSVKGLDQAPTVAQQTPSTDIWNRMRDVLGPPFDSERVTLYQMRQMRKDAMIAFGLHYIKVPLVRAEWHIEARDKDGPNAQVAAFVDAALRPIYARLHLPAHARTGLRLPGDRQALRHEESGWHLC